MNHIRYYSFYITLIKSGMFLCIIGILSYFLFLFYDNLNAKKRVNELLVNQGMLSKKGIANTSEVTINNPRFFGVSSDDRPYTVIAKSGNQINKNLVELFDVFGDIDLQNNNFVLLKSDIAVLELDKDNLEMTGNVEVLIEDQYIINTDKAFINYKNQSGYGYNPIRIESDSTTITADEFLITDHHKELILKGKRVKTVVMNSIVVK